MNTIQKNRYYLPEDYEENLNPEPWSRKFFGPDGGEIPQWDVYETARKIALKNDHKKILDIGCGDGLMINSFFGGGDYARCGIDTIRNVDICKKNYSDAAWHALDLEKITLLDLEYFAPEMVICADVIEHLVRPDNLLNSLSALYRKYDTTIVLSTPERNLKRGFLNHSRPKTPNHVREWTITEFQMLLRDFNLNDPLFFIVPANKNTQNLMTLVAVVM
jgi:hypothetical protein